MKTAFIFDTNFILQNSKLNEVVDNLKEDYNVYVTQVSIDERIAQQCRELKSKYEEVERCKSQYSDFAEVTVKVPYDATAEAYRKAVQSKYEACFGDNIIPYSSDSETFECILRRANDRIPPFLSEKGASDKGFKDCLMWISIVQFFKTAKENKVVFLTDDKSAFTKNTEFLVSEFKEYTSKEIEFKPNSYYRELLKSTETKAPTPPKEDKPLDTKVLRDKIETVISGICGLDSYDCWGNETWDRTFFTSQYVDSEYIRVVFEGLKSVIDSHIFEKNISGVLVFGLDERIQNGETNIPMDNLEAAFNLYESIKTKYPEYITQFYNAVASIVNKNYVKPTVSFEDAGELPF